MSKKSQLKLLEGENIYPVTNISSVEELTDKIAEIEDKIQNRKLTWKVFRDLNVNPYLDVVLVNNTTLEKVITYNLDDIDTSEYTPIGIVVIPEEHDVYGTGEMGVMGLAYLDYENPETGSITDVNSVHMYFGENKTISGIPSGKYAPHYGTMDGSPSFSLKGLTPDTSYIMLPSDKWTDGYTYEKDISSKWANYSDSTRYYCPSPYMNDGSKNSDYFIKSGVYSNNRLVCFDGKGYTNLILEKATGQPDWKTDEKITNSTSVGCYPAACCSYRFHTIGTNQGDWYLPAAGELGYVGVRFKKIDETIQYINRIFGNVGIGIIYNDNLSGSQAVTETATMRISTNNSAIGTQNRNIATIYRPFIKIKK